MAKGGHRHCHGCKEGIDPLLFYIFVKCKGQPMRYYCEKCAKERGYHGNS